MFLWYSKNYIYKLNQGSVNNLCSQPIRYTGSYLIVGIDMNNGNQILRITKHTLKPTEMHF